MAMRTLVLLSALGSILLPAAPVTAQAQPASNVPRGPDGKPDLQGFWDFRSLTPLERPANLADKPFLTEEEAANLERQNAERRARLAAQAEVRTEARTPGGGGQAVGGYNDFWMDGGVRVVGDRRTSLIVDPPDGKLPPLVAGARRQVGSMNEDLALDHPVRILATGTSAGGPEDRGLSERCLVGFNAGPPMLPSGYNNHMQFVQTPTHVAILNEMVHDVRIIPLDNRPLLPETIRQWAGVSRGRWEGDTLVVTTTHFTDKTPSFSPNVVTALGSGQSLSLTERFRRIDRDTLEYEFTVEDPATFTRPFTALVPMRRSEEPVFEYACHEGNYGLRSILRGARTLEATGDNGGRP